MEIENKALWVEVDTLRESESRLVLENNNLKRKLQVFREMEATVKRLRTDLSNIKTKIGM